MQFHPWLMGMRRAMEMVLTGDALSGSEAVAAGFATRCFADEELEAATLAMAERIAAIPPDIAALNKRAVHRQMEAMGLRAGLRQGTELCTLATHQASFKAFIEATAGGDKLTEALSDRDRQFGDYRTDEVGE